MRKCLDCGYSGKKFVAGACPACGSFRIEAPTQEELPRVRKPLQLAFLVTLWGYLFYLIWQNLQA